MKEKREFICPLDVGMLGDITQFLVQDCKTVEEAKERLKRLGYQVELEKENGERPTY